MTDNPYYIPFYRPAYTYFTPNAGSSALNSLTSDRLYLLPFVFDKPWNPTALVFTVSSFFSPAAVKFALYGEIQQDRSLPFVADLGEVLVNSAADYAIDLAGAYTLQGSYWLAYMFSPTGGNSYRAHSQLAGARACIGTGKRDNPANFNTTLWYGLSSTGYVYADLFPSLDAASLAAFDSGLFTHLAVGFRYDP